MYIVYHYKDQKNLFIQRLSILRDLVFILFKCADIKGTKYRHVFIVVSETLTSYILRRNEI